MLGETICTRVNVRVTEQACAGGYGSEDSEAYIPLVKSALQRDANTRGAEAAASHLHRDGRNTGGADHLVEASSQLARESTPPSEALGAGGADKVAHDNTSMTSHADVKKADDETEVHATKAKQPLLGGCAQSASGEGTCPEASAGAGVKKRKSRHKKGKSRAAKRPAQHDNGAEAAAERDGCPETTEAAPGSSVCDEQRLADLREAALMWAQQAQQARQTPTKEQNGTTPQQ